MNAIITSTGDFTREAHVSRVQALQETFHLQFTSKLLSAKNPDDRQVNFGLLLRKVELVALRHLIDAAVGAA
jgi:hypothetical protein